MSRSFINELEELVLLTAAVQDPDAYAYSIRKEINEQTGRTLSLASVHTVLYRLEKDGLLKSRLGGQSERRGGRSKRLFTVTQTGRETIEEIKNVRQAYWAKIQTI